MVDLPLWKIWIRQWEGWHPIYEMKNHPNVPNISKPPTRRFISFYLTSEFFQIRPVVQSPSLEPWLSREFRDVSSDTETPWPWSEATRVPEKIHEKNPRPLRKLWKFGEILQFRVRAKKNPGHSSDKKLFYPGSKLWQLGWKQQQNSACLMDIHPLIAMVP